MNNTIKYKEKMRLALETIVKDILCDVQKNGLPGKHHFYITFHMNFPKLEISNWLREKYPEEMTIVVQHWYDNLRVDNDYFEITLNFGNSPERMKIPFGSIKTFVDPSADFGIKLDQSDFQTSTIKMVEEPEEASELAAEALEDISEELEHEKGGEVVSLDSFRKT